jgi:hypothetical protein
MLTVIMNVNSEPSVRRYLGGLLLLAPSSSSSSTREDPEAMGEWIRSLCLEALDNPDAPTPGPFRSLQLALRGQHIILLCVRSLALALLWCEHAITDSEAGA